MSTADDPATKLQHSAGSWSEAANVLHAIARCRLKLLKDLELHDEFNIV